MKDITSPAYLNNQLYNFDIINGLKVHVNLTSNPYQIPLESLFAMAGRKNSNRGFLFVSKVLGKHIPVNPNISLLAGIALAARYTEIVCGQKVEQLPAIVNAITNNLECKNVYETLKSYPFTLPQDVVFIGFAETATALGHAMFDSFCDKATYIHTTRELVPQLTPLLSFEEEHSHATTHRLYAVNKNILNVKSPIVLVDDEITTGRTALNFIEAIQKKFPRKEYVLASLLDWRSEFHRRKFSELEKRLGIRITTVSLLAGTIDVIGQPVEEMSSDNNMSLDSVSNVVIEKIYLKELKPHAYIFTSKNTLGVENKVPFLSLSGRFGLSHKDTSLLHQIDRIGEKLSKLRKGKRTLCMGTCEFMYIPMLIAARMGKGVKYQSTTRSPIHAINKQGYAVQFASCYQSPEDSNVLNYIYNIPHDFYDELFLFFERETDDISLHSLLNKLRELGIPQIHLVFFMDKHILINNPEPMGSYSKEDVTFLLKNISQMIEEKNTEAREQIIQSGGHYSEMLPVEYKPSAEYMDLYADSLMNSAHKLASAVGIVSETIINARGNNLVFVSLARAGTPIGILIKRYIRYKFNLDLPHYSISIIRGKGIDENAISYILQQHPGCDIQFIDGWTGKGAITKVLAQACQDFKTKYGFSLNDDLAVLADPGHCVKTYGTREDFLIPSACLNSTVSGLVSRTVHRSDIIGENDFHGAKFYTDLKKDDVSKHFVETIERHFPLIQDTIVHRLKQNIFEDKEPTWQGMIDIESLQKEFSIDDINLIKPGVGETTRVLLRRFPWKILVKKENDPNLLHIFLLAKDRGVPIMFHPDMTYSCCGIIKPIDN